MLSRLLVPVVVCAALAAAPAFADRGHKQHHRHDGYHREAYRTEIHYRPVYRVVPPPMVVAPAPYYYGRPGRGYAVHHHHHGCGHDDDAWMWIGGSMLMGAILHDIYD
jgi:hypothetical protein